MSTLTNECANLAVEFYGLPRTSSLRLSLLTELVHVVLRRNSERTRDQTSTPALRARTLRHNRDSAAAVTDFGLGAPAQTTTVRPRLHSSSSGSPLSDDIKPGKCHGEDDLTLVSLAASSTTDCISSPTAGKPTPAIISRGAASLDTDERPGRISHDHAFDANIILSNILQQGIIVDVIRDGGQGDQYSVEILQKDPFKMFAVLVELVDAPYETMSCAPFGTRFLHNHSRGLSSPTNWRAVRTRLWDGGLSFSQS